MDASRPSYDCTPRSEHPVWLRYASRAVSLHMVHCARLRARAMPPRKNRPYSRRSVAMRATRTVVPSSSSHWYCCCCYWFQTMLMPMMLLLMMRTAPTIADHTSCLPPPGTHKWQRLRVVIGTIAERRRHETDASDCVPLSARWLMQDHRPSCMVC